MRKILLTFSLLLGLFLVSCSSNNPKAVAEKFLNALYNEDYTEAKKYCDKQTAEILDVLDGFAKEAQKGQEDKKKDKKDKKDFKIVFTKVEENGDKAKVFYKKPKEFVDEEGGDDKDQDKESSLDLKKVDGKWLVSINKEQGMKEQGLQGHDHGDEGDMDLPEEDTAPDDAPEAQDSIPAAQ